METIGKQILWTFYDGVDTAQRVDKRDFRSGEGHRVKSFLELATKVAELQFLNRDHVLLFRGQKNDHRNFARNTTLKPSMFRTQHGAKNNPGPDVLMRRFQTLQLAEEKLVQRYEQAGLMGHSRLQRHRILRWSILQHYEVCATPLLDVTHSLRIAASFASIGAAGEAFFYVLGVPNLSGAITASAEAELQIVRLSSVCPPAAIRPHIQEGYLLGEYPEMVNYDQKALYDHYEVDFGRRLVAKFRFSPKEFWKKSGSFPQVNERALYPSVTEDPLCKLALEIKGELPGTP